METKDFEVSFSEQDVEVFGKKVLAKITDKVKEDIADAFYTTYAYYLDEHYSNAKSKIEAKVIEQITEKYVKDPTSYKYNDLRRKIWDEHKDEILPSLTDEAITDSMQNTLECYTHRDYRFSWKWKENIARLIVDNFELFRDDERVMSVFGRELENKNSRIASLEQKIREIEEITDNDR